MCPRKRGFVHRDTCPAPVVRTPCRARRLRHPNSHSEWPNGRGARYSATELKAGKDTPIDYRTPALAFPADGDSGSVLTGALIPAKSHLSYQQAPKQTP